jgi:hypothetical protein
MAATWNYALQFPRELMQEIQAFKKIQEHEYDEQLEYYDHLRYSISKADKVGLRGVLLNLDNIFTMISALPEREKILWREMMGEIELRNCGAEFAAFVERRIEWTLVQVKWSRRERRNEEREDADGRDTGRN